MLLRSRESTVISHHCHCYLCCCCPCCCCCLCCCGGCYCLARRTEKTSSSYRFPATSTMTTMTLLLLWSSSHCSAGVPGQIGCDRRQREGPTHRRGGRVRPATAAAAATVIVIATVASDTSTAATWGVKTRARSSGGVYIWNGAKEGRDTLVVASSSRSLCSKVMPRHTMTAPLW